jgi:hypothetical protein
MPETVRKAIDLDKDLYERFKEQHPTASLWWIINALLRAYLDDAEQTPPKSLMLRAVQKVRSGDYG